jgi:hypothetical protein
MATATMTKINIIWKSSISLPVKIKLYKSLVLSILLYGCESWTLIAECEHRIQAFEHKSYRKILRITYKEHKTNAYVRDKINMYTGKQEQLLSVVKRCKLAWYGHVTRHDPLSKTIMQGTVSGSRKRGRQRKERLGLITLKNGQASVFSLNCVLLRGETSGGLCVVMHPP